MPTQRLSMRRIREVLRFRHQGLTERVIARMLGVSNGVVHGYLRRARLAGLTWPLPEGMDDDGLELLLFPAPTAASQSDRRPAPDWIYVEKELRRRSVTRLLLWEEYRAANPDGFGYTWFCTTFEAWKKRARPTMRQTHVGGEKVFVDFAGDTIDIFDPITGEAHAMKLFVAAMGASNYTYFEACPSESLPDWIGMHINLFRFLGGVPKFVVCDNLKAAVTNPDRYDPGLNRTYAEMARHYGTAILAARPRRPKDKAKVEVAVQIAQRWVLARLRNQRFFSLAELNAAIGALVIELNARQMRGFGSSRAELFAEIDKLKLAELPDQPYIFARWKRCRVAPDYHVEIDGHWYSTPYRLIRELALRQSACVEDIDLRTPRSIDRAVFARLVVGDWIDRNENLLVTGATGLGKSWIACALGHKACRDNRSVQYHRVPRLFEALALARGDGRYGRLLKTLGRVQLLILDDWGLSVLNPTERRDLLEILDDRHGRASTIVTSQIPVEHWHDIIGDPTLGDAILDRIVHNAHRLQLTGESMRKRNARNQTLDAASIA